MKSKKYELITVVIAAHNSRRTIEKCLLSIKAQTYPNVEIVVVDSKNYNLVEMRKCKKIITKYARYYQDGPERSIQRNRGIKEAKGECVLIVDQDMYLSVRVVEECYSMITKNRYVALTIPEISIGEGFWTECVAFERYITNVLGVGMNECCRFFKKKDAISIGGYDPSIVGVEDSDFHYRMAMHGKIGKIKSIIEHDEGRTFFWKRVGKKYYYSKAFREYLKRYPAIAAGQFFPLKLAYVKHFDLMIRKPKVSLGMFLLRGAEVFAGFLGLVFNR